MATPQTAQNARERCQAIRRVNAALQPPLDDRREQLSQRLAETSRKLQAESILAWREYAFCLYPESTLREFCRGYFTGQCKDGLMASALVERIDPMSQDDVSSRSTDSNFAEDDSPPRAATAGLGKGLRPRDRPVLPADRCFKVRRPSSSRLRWTILFYEPRDRLLLRHWREIVAHVHIAQRTMLFGRYAFPWQA